MDISKQLGLRYKTDNIFIIYLGIIFYSLTVINLSFDYLKDNIKILFFNSNIITLLEGTVLTAIINSSSTLIISSGILYANATISLEQGISLMLGANIGTTITTYFYTLNQNIKVKKIIVYNILFNLFGALLFLCFIDYFIILLKLLNILQYKKQTIAIAHLIFNILTTLLTYILLIPFKFKEQN